MHQVTPPKQKVVTVWVVRICKSPYLEGISVDFMPSWVSLESLLEGKKW